MSAAWEYEQAVNNVANWFNTDAGNVWNTINAYNLTPQQVQDMLPTVDSFLYGQGANEGYTAIKYANGEVATWNNVYSTSQAAAGNAVDSALNSNSATTALTVYQAPANTTFNQDGKFAAQKGVSGGMSNSVNLSSALSLAVVGTGLGAKLGKNISNELYMHDPDFWDSIGLSTMNPATWDSLTIDMSDTGWEGHLKRAVNGLLGIDNQGNAQMYIDENMAAYLAMYMNQNHFFDPLEEQSDDYTGQRNWLSYPNSYNYPIAYTSFPSVTYESNGIRYEKQCIGINGDVHFAFYQETGSPTINFAYFSNQSGASFTTHIKSTNISTGTVSEWNNTTNLGAMASSAAGQYYGGNGGDFAVSTASHPTYNYNVNSVNGTVNARDFAIIYYHSDKSTSGGVDGVTQQSGATTPNFSGCSTPADYLAALQSQFPDMFNNKISQTVAQPDGTTTTRNYVPIGTASGTGTQDAATTTSANTTGQTQADTIVNPNNASESLLKTLLQYMSNTRTPDSTDTPNPTDTGTGGTPTVVVPTGSASALWSVYNPSQAQLNSFGAWLWSSNFIDQILKLFNNPMQSIIGVHKIFATPATSGAGNITVGYLDSGVSANLVSNQYTDIDCGTVNVREQFGNVFDYTDTHIRLYLPFIGIVDLDTSDVMRGAVKVVYHVDVITGACLAEVKVTRDTGGGTLYQYAGDAAVRYPISSGSYMGVVSGILSAVGGVASAVMTGGATLPLAAGAVAGGISGAHTQVQHSGNFSGNAGAMGGKKPYLIIERPQSYIANDFKHWQGLGANTRRTVGQMSGYFKFSDVHTESISKAAESEIEAIRAALESGVIA